MAAEPACPSCLRRAALLARLAPNIERAAAGRGRRPLRRAARALGRRPRGCRERVRGTARAPRRRGVDLPPPRRLPGRAPPPGGFGSARPLVPRRRRASSAESPTSRRSRSSARAARAPTGARSPTSSASSSAVPAWSSSAGSPTASTPRRIAAPSTPAGPRSPSSAAASTSAIRPGSGPSTSESPDRASCSPSCPPGTTPWRWTFPARNRIMAALGDLTLVVEAAQRSGSLITVRIAQSLGRDVGAVPGPINSRFARGSNALLADGAFPVLGADSVLDELLGPGVRPAAAARPARSRARGDPRARRGRRGDARRDRPLDGPRGRCPRRRPRPPGAARPRPHRLRGPVSRCRSLRLGSAHVR